MISENLDLSENNINNIILVQNPVQDKIELISTELINEITISDLSGKMIKSNKNIYKKSTTYIVNVNDLPIGVFICNLKLYNGKTKTIKFIKK